MFDTLGDDAKTLLAARAAEFQRALDRDTATDWEPFLRGYSGDVRLVLLANFVARDLDHRWGKGERPELEEYLARYPELGPRDKVPPALILEEHRCRIRSGEVVDLSRYRARFPAQYGVIEADLSRSAAGGTVVAPRLQMHRWEAVPDARVAVSHQYELVRELGRGMYGEVWLARSPSGIMKAIKILLQAADRDAGQRELKSLELIKNLRHPYLLATEDFWTTSNRLHIVMELAEGTLRGLLKGYLAQGKPGVPADELFQYIAEAAEGLDFLHSQKVTHRDVKPDNILILHGHAKVADFGLARAQEQGLESMSLAGTPAYMAPEIWGGAGGPASDQYSLAFAYTELRQGRSPLKPRPMVELMIAHQEGSYEFADVVTPDERAVLRKALAAKPQDRYPTCTDFAAALADALGRPFAGGAHRIAGRGAHLVNSAPYSGSTGAFESGSLPVPMETGAAGETLVVDSLPRKPAPEPPAPPKPRPPQVSLVAGTLGLFMLVGFGGWLLTRGPDPTPTTNPDRTTAKTTDPDPTPNPPGPIIEPKPPGVTTALPPNTAADPGARTVTIGGKKVPEWVFAERNGAKVRFRLIVPGAGPNTRPFYITETKVTKKVYATGDDTPAVDVPMADTRAFAGNGFGGDLPTADEWDHAAGLFEPGAAGHPLATGRAWIGQAAPGAVTRPDAAANGFGLIDTTGNGREWTRTVLAPSLDGKLGARRDLAPNDNPAKGEKVILRGRSFASDGPLTFAQLEYERTTLPQAANATASAYTGFRVVLPVP